MGNFVTKALFAYEEGREKFY